MGSGPSLWVFYILLFAISNLLLAFPFAWKWLMAKSQWTDSPNFFTNQAYYYAKVQHDSETTGSLTLILRTGS